MKARGLLGRRWARFGIAVGLVGVTTLICELTQADRTIAGLALLVAVLLAALLGILAGSLAALASFAGLNWFFTPPLHSFAIAKTDDLIAGVMFLIAAGLIGWVVNRLADLRAYAEQRALEARIRLDLTSRLTAGDDPERVAASAAAAIVALFGLTTTTVRLGDASAGARGPGDALGVTETVQLGDVTVEGRADAALDSADRAVLEALVAALAGAQDQRRLGDETREARVAIQVSQSRAGLLSAVSHNLRTPLASIKAAASTLRSSQVELDPADRRDLLDIVVEETERLERVVSKTLDLSRIRAGGLELERSTVDLGDVASASVRRLRPLARAHRVRLDIDPDLPPVTVDVALLEEVFLNLLENALRFAPPGSEILVSVTRTGREVEVRVIDHGPGVAPEHRTRIFEEFTTIESRPDARGTGLGLAIVRALVAAHDGRVWVEDTPGGGATFVFVLHRAGTP